MQEKWDYSRLIYMDNASESWPKAPGLQECMAQAVAAAPSGSLGAGGCDAAKLCRRMLSEMMGISDGKRIVFTLNATHAINLALQGFPWMKDDLVFTTAAEHNSVLRPLFSLKQNGKIRDFKVLPVEGDGRISPEFLESCIVKETPRMLVFTHANGITGALNDAKSIARICRKHHVLTLLDASLTIGLYPVCVEDWGIDMAAAAGHKYLLSPSGTGFLYCDESIDLQPSVEGATGIYPDRWGMPDELPMRLESGESNRIGLAGMAYCLAWRQKNKTDTRRLGILVDIMERSLCKWGFEPLRVSGTRIPILSLDGFAEPAELSAALQDSYNIISGNGIFCTPLLLRYLGIGSKGVLRLSLSRFNTEDEVQALILALQDLSE